MALANIPAKIITTTGLNRNGEFSELAYINSAPTYVSNTTWAQFITRSGYNGGLFNLTWALEKPAGTYTQRITLKNGNYAVETITISVSGDSYTTSIDVKLYRADNTLLKDICDFGSGISHGKWDKYLIVVMYNDSNNHWVNVEIRHNTVENAIYCIKSETSTSYSEYIGWMLGSIAPNDPYGTQEDNETPQGGYGPYNYTSEQELPPSVPSVSAADVGFISLWNPTAAELKALANWLWTGNFAINTWRAITADPMDCILSVGIIPITPARKQYDGTDHKYEIEFAGSGSNVTSYRVENQYYVIDMGSLHIGGMSNSNMDYAPYAKASIFLPYCGTYALDVDEIMDADIALEYHIDIYTGACVAYLTISNKVNSDEHEVDAVMYQFTGNVLATIPVTSVDHSQFIQSLLFMGASVAATVATAGGGAGAAAAGADLGAEAGMSAGAIAATAGSAINTVMSMKPNVLHSGNLSSTAGFLGGQKPYVTMTWSNLCRADDEYKVVGMPLNKSGKLTDFKGLTVVSGVHLENIKCTDTERIMIEQALYKGVIV